MQDRSDSSSRRGFTLLEIMISVVILTVGLMGVLALFPVAIKNSADTIRETTAVMLAQSVEQAIRDGLRSRKGQSKDGKWTYFIFQHEGVLDQPPVDLNLADPGRDYYILLPDTDSTNSAVPREAAYKEGKVFVFPETDGHTWVDRFGEEVSDNDANTSPNGGGDPTRADNDGDDRELDNGETTYDIRRVYHLGPDPDLAEELAEDDDRIVGPDADPRITYCYAFSIRRAYNDASALIQSSSFAPLGELFEVEIMIFRSFIAGTRQADPVYTTSVLVEK